MQQFLRQWFFDWLTLTIPNGTTGKGTRSEGARGDVEVGEAERRLCTWATVNGLRRMRLGKGSDGYAAGMPMAFDPLAQERVVTIRTGHKTNMPGIEMPGADGACARLAPFALDELGPVLIARADVSYDVSQEGLMDALEDYARKHSKQSGMEPPSVTSSGSGRSWTWGKGEASVIVYQKDLERVNDGKLAPKDADENLTRIEVRLRPKKGRKAGLARLARDEGAGSLLGTVLWVRRFVEHIAKLTEAAEETTIEVQRVDSTPDPRTARDRADHGLSQYSATFCKAAAADIVQRDFDGDWLAAEVKPEQIIAMVTDWVRHSIRDTSQAVVTELGLDEVRQGEAEAQRLAVDLREWITRQEEETRDAQEHLEGSLERVLAGQPYITPDDAIEDMAA